MTCQPVIIDGQSCVQCPEVLPRPAVPAQLLVTPNFGWNASAVSRRRYSGDVFTQFTAPACTGVVIGLVPERRSHAPRDVSHGFYLYQSGGVDWWSVVEYGQPLGMPTRRTTFADVFRIERVRERVLYYVNGRMVRRSERPLPPGSLQVICLLYAAGDRVN